MQYRLIGRVRSNLQFEWVILVNTDSSMVRALARAPECPEFLGSKSIRSGIKIPCASPDPSEPPGKKRVLGLTPDPSGIGSEARQSPDGDNDQACLLLMPCGYGIL